MGKNVFANGLEISCKQSDNKSVAAMPDVCLSPPAPPAGPLPIPYPNTGVASDTTDGSRTVQIGGAEVGLKNQSSYKKSDGDQPATRSFGAGEISHNITGPVKFSAWSMDVKIEGANATRFMDLTTHNHANPGNGALTNSIAALEQMDPDDIECKHLSEANAETRNEMIDSDLKTLQNVGKGNTTITHGVYTTPFGVGVVLRASSREVVTKYDASFCKGMSKQDKMNNLTVDGKVKSQACGEHVYNRGFFMPHTSHTEARMLEDIFAGTPTDAGYMGTLLLSIDWPGGEDAGLDNKAPCAECKRLICAATECLDIFICDENEEKQEPDCP